MRICEIARKMIAESGGTAHDTRHFMKVWSYAKIIGELEGLSGKALYTLETAALVHDIACPLCREKYGSTAGPYQEREGAVLARSFLEECGVPQDVVDRVCHLVSRHHTFEGVEGEDWRILLEADFIVNAEESNYSAEQIRRFRDRVFKTASGTMILNALFAID